MLSRMGGVGTWVLAFVLFYVVRSMVSSYLCIDYIILN